MLELHVDPNADISTGAIPISWCVDRDLLNQLKAINILDPQVVIITSPKDNYFSFKETRIVVPLKDLMAYVSFKTPGENNIRAFISIMPKRIAKTSYLAKGIRGGYDTNVLDHDGVDFWCGTGNGRDGDDYHRFKYGSNTVVVDVPKECFAPPPPAWEVLWVNWLMSDKVVDQCDYRRRRLFAYSVQPIILLLRQLWLLPTILVAALIGARDFSLRYLLHPLTTELCSESLGYDICGGGTIFLRETKEDDMPDDEFRKLNVKRLVWAFIKKVWTLPFMPVILIPILLLAHFHKLLWVGSICGGVIGVVLIIAFFATGAFTDAINALTDWLTTSKQAWYTNEEQANQVVCTGAPITLKSLKHRTLRLRFQEVKSKVCKPFAG